jgi:hypothetical protein
MQPTDIHQIMAGQIDHMKPAHLEPGRHIGMAVVDETTLLVLVIPTATIAIVRYCQAGDDYSVTVNRQGKPVQDHDRIYCDQLGDLIFGIDASEWTMPFGGIQVIDGDGNVISEELF